MKTTICIGKVQFEQAGLANVLYVDQAAQRFKSKDIVRLAVRADSPESIRPGRLTVNCVSGTMIAFEEHIRAVIPAAADGDYAVIEVDTENEVDDKPTPQQLGDARDAIMRDPWRPRDFIPSSGIVDAVARKLAEHDHDHDIAAVEAYLASCVRRRDWHGVSDAANDMRVLEAIREARR